MQFKKLPIFYRTLNPNLTLFISEQIEVNEENSDFQHLLNRFKHIVEEIFGYLDLQDLTKSRLVSKSWKSFIDNMKLWYICQWKNAFGKPMEFCKTDGILTYKRLFLEQFPYWKDTFEYFETKATLIEVKQFAAIMRNYYCSREPTNLCPIFNAILPEINYEILEFFHEKSPMDFNVLPSPGGGNLLHFACGLRLYSIISFLIKGSARKPIGNA